TLGAGGAERVVSELPNEWAHKGWTVALLTLSSQALDHYRVDSNVHRIALDMLGDSRSAWQGIYGSLKRCLAIRRAVRRFSPQVVLSFVDQMNVLVLAATAGTGIPVIVSERIDPRRHRLPKRWSAARRLLYPFARALVVQTNSVASWAKAIVQAENVRVIPNFLRSLSSLPSIDSRSSDEVLAVGRLDRQKGFDVLLRALAKVRGTHPGVKLTILGEGPERNVLEELARDLRILDSVHLPGVVKHPEQWMARCTLFVLPSRYEGFPNALLEAMALGCAVVAADCDSGPRELVSDGDNGLLVPPGDVEGLANAIRVLLSDPDMQRRFGDRAAGVRERYARERIVREWEALIARCIEQPRAIGT